jgi:hypothetical protein
MPPAPDHHSSQPDTTEESPENPVESPTPTQKPRPAPNSRLKEIKSSIEWLMNYEAEAIEAIVEEAETLLDEFPDPSLTEKCAMRMLMSALTRLERYLLQELGFDSHDLEVEPHTYRGLAAAQRDFWRALGYLERRLDVRARRRERIPSLNELATRFQPDPQTVPPTLARNQAQTPEKTRLPSAPEPDPRLINPVAPPSPNRIPRLSPHEAQENDSQEQPPSLDGLPGLVEAATSDEAAAVHHGNGVATRKLSRVSPWLERFDERRAECQLSA